MSSDISETGMIILEYLWSRDTPAKFSEILDYCNKTKKTGWKKQTVNTFLTRLFQKGFISIDKTHPRALYSPTISREIYYQQQAKKIVDASYHGSITDFLCAFTGNHKLTISEKEELLDFIERL